MLWQPDILCIVPSLCLEMVWCWETRSWLQTFHKCNRGSVPTIYTHIHWRLASKDGSIVWQTGTVNSLHCGSSSKSPRWLPFRFGNILPKAPVLFQPPLHNSHIVVPQHSTAQGSTPGQNSSGNHIPCVQEEGPVSILWVKPQMSPVRPLAVVAEAPS